MGGDWLTTKKVGRDDALIARDRSNAVQARKNQRRKTSNTKKPAAKKSRGGRGGSRKVSSPSTEEASDSDEDSFLVDDDEELSVDEASSSEDEIIAMAKRSQEKRRQPRVAKKQSASMEESASSSEDESLVVSKRKPPPRNKYLTKADIGSTSGDTSSDTEDGEDSKRKPALAQKKKTVKSEDSSSGNSSSDTDDGDSGFLDSPVFQKRKSKQAPHMAQRTKMAPKWNKKSKPPSSNIFEKFKFSSESQGKSSSSQYFARRKPASAKTSQGEGGVLAQSTVAKASDKKMNLSDSSVQGSDSDDDDIIPVGRPSANRKRKAAFSNEDEDDSPWKKKPNKQSSLDSTKDSAFLDDDDDNMDEDEQTALALALSRSVHEEEQSKKTKQKQVLIDLEDSDNSDIEEEQDANEEFVEEDAEAKTAATVLATANKLSLTVLKTMQILSKKASDTKSNDGGNKGPVGMIVDGALALHDLSSVNANDSSHDFISPELMKEICPNVTLAGYQIIGVNWMALLHGMQVAVDGSKKKTNVNGILADEMGLGKTAQTICFLAWLKYKNQGIKPNAKSDKDGNEAQQAIDLVESDDEVVDDLDLDHDDDEEAYGEDKKKVHAPYDHACPHLIVVPASVLSNWEREFQKFAPHLKVVKYHGSQAERFKMQEELRLHLPKNAKARNRAGLEPLDIILAPITYFSKESSPDRAFLGKFKFDYLICDEAHLLKNAQGNRYKKLDSFDTQHRLLLTGTPVQNSPNELLNLLMFLMPLFKRNTSGYDEDGKDRGTEMLRHFVSVEGAAKGGVVDDASVYRKLKQLFAPFVLRRRKADVLSQIMPPKERKVEFVEMDGNAKAIYQNVISEHLASKRAKTKTPSDHVFTELRKAAHHPLLLRTRYKSPQENEVLSKLFHQYGFFGGDGCHLSRIKEETTKMNDLEVHLAAQQLIDEKPIRAEMLGKYTLEADDLYSSAKCVRLRSLLPKLVSEGHRVLIFSCWTSCLDLLTFLLDQLDMKYLRMEGSTAVSERQALIDQFTNDTTIPVFLLSTKACGLGINLTAADTCIMHDIDFNPFNDLQAEDRVHRIGQKKTTTVIKLVTKDTVDADIYEMQERKARMNAAIMDNNGAFSEDQWKKSAKVTKEVVVKSAVERFLKSDSPSAKDLPFGKDDEEDL